MVRAGLASKRRIGQGPRLGAAYVPAATVVLASLLSVLPIISNTGWYPDFAFLVLLGWRLLRSDAFPAWWAAPLGFLNDLLVGHPVGLSVALWALTMLALDLIDRRTMWRDYWVEWVLAALFVALAEWAEWRTAGLMGAQLPLSSILPPMLIAIFVFPVIAWLVSRLDHWRLGR